MIKNLVLSFLSLLALQSFSQENILFDVMNGPTGGRVSDIESNSSGELFAISNDKLYRSLDNAATWIDISPDATDGLIDVFVDDIDQIYLLDKTKVWTSLDNGDTWSSVTATGAYNPRGKLLKNPNTGSLFCMSNTNFGLMRSNNEGASWTMVYDGSSATLRDYAIGNSGLIFLGTSGPDKLHKSSDNGNSFVTDSDPSLTNPRTGADITSVEVNKFNGKVYILYFASEGIYVTTGTNDGTAWAQVTVASPLTFPAPDNNWHSLIPSKTTGRIYVRDGQDLYYSDNALTGAGTWTQLVNYNAGNNEFLVGRALSSANIFMGLGEDGIYGSTTSGSSWTFRDRGIYNNRTRSFLRTNNGNLLAVNGASAIAFSNDNGQNWTKQGLCGSCNFTTLIKKPNGNLLAIGNETYGSTAANGGAAGTWTDLGGPPVSIQLENVVSHDGDLIWGISGETVLYRSTNGGVAFSAPTINGLPSPLRVFRVGLSATNDLFVWTDTDEVYKIPSTAGAPPFTATRITNSGLTSFRGIKSVNGIVYLFGFDNAAGSEAYAKSIDGGATWTRQSIDSSNDVFVVTENIMFSHESTGGDQASIKFTNNAGMDWFEVFNGPFYDSQIAGAAVDEFGVGYLAISRAPLRRSQGTIVKPNKPTNLKTIGFADKVVYLEWDYSESGGAILDYYEIERKPTSGGAFEKIGEADGGDLYFADRTAVKNTAYDYRVIAGSNAGENTSDPVSVTTKDDCPLSLPDNRSWTGLVSPPGTPTAGPVLIRKVSSDYYEISEFTAGTLNGVPRNGGGTYTSTSVSALFNFACSTPFIEENDDVYPNGNGNWDGTTLTLNFQIDKGEYTDTEKTINLTLSPADPAPEVPENLSAYVVSDTQIQLQWTAGDYQQSYVIERSLTTTTGFSQVGTVNYPALTFTDSGPFTNGTTYFYRVKARNFGALLESAYSPEVSVVFNSPIFVLSNTVVSSTAASVPTMAWGDLDNDGFEDLVMAKLNFFGQAAEEPLLFRNNGSANFQLLTGKFPTALNFVGPTIADYNNDGNLDIFISGFGIDGAGNTTRNYLLRNNGDLTFTDLDTSPVAVIEPGQSAISASWVDVNANGFIDLFVPYEDGAGQKLFAGSAGGTFTENAGAGALITDSFSKGTAVWADYDNDGDMDVFVVSGSDTNPNRLYNNDGGTFTRVTPSAFDGDLGNFFSASWGDYDNDQDLDLFVADQEGPNLLYRNNGNGTFTKVSQAANSPTENLTVNSTGSAWGDVDNDGDIDLVVTSAAEPNLLYINQGNGTFTKKTNESISGFNTLFNLGAAFADYDNDGHLDVVIGALNFPIGGESGVLGDPSPIRLYRNNVTSGNWIKIKLNGAGGPNASVSNRTAIGARIRIVAGGKTQIREITSLSGTGAQSSLIAHFGLGADATITSIDVRFPSGSQKTLNDISANQLLEIDEDSEGPVISPFTPQNVDKGFGELAVSIVASDAVATSEVRVLRRAIGGSEFMIEPMIRETGTNNWQITALESWYDDMGLEFYFEAEDPFGNVSRSPATGNYYSYMNYKETNAPKFPSGSLVFGGTDRTWNIISIPFDLGNEATVTSVIEELGAADETAWRLLTYQNQTEWAEFPSSFSSFVRGKGYFLNVKTPPSQGITIADPLLAPQNNQSNLFAIDLNQGWNQIGNPYLVPITWADVKAFNSTVSGVGDLKVYNSNGRTYADGNTLGVYQGGFVFANEAVQDYLISFTGQTPGGRKASSGRIASTELDHENWRTMFTLKQSDVEFTLGGIGMSPDAKLSYDDFDDVTVPRLNDFLEMNFHHPEHFAKRFSRDVVPTQGEFTWEFTVDSNLKGIATLNWDNEAFGLNEKELYLYDMAQQKPIDMRETNSYSFDATQSNRFKVYYGANLKNRIQPERIMLGQAFPNPANAVTTIPFTLPESAGMYQVRLDVYDMMGRRVDTLHDGQLPAGFYESTWDTTNGQITNGLYTYRLAVAGDGKKEVFSNKIILNK